ncbi:MAG: universal stress protein [Acidobacteriota bacterium]|nr:universal stress protein [Acidobacteriota bacterium]
MPVTGNHPEVNVDTVVFATDFCASSETAGLYALQLAEHLHASLLVAHSFLLTRAAEEAELRTHAESRQRADLEIILNEKTQALSSSRVRVTSALVEGAAHEAIPLLAEKHAPALVVLGTHGGGRLEHELIGSVAERILRSTRWPCLTINPHVAKPAGPTLSFKRVLFATDFTPAATRAAVFAISFSEDAEGSLDVLNVLPDSARNNSQEWEETKERFTRALEQLVPNHAREFISPHTFVETGDAHKRILAHVRERSIDLLVLGIRKSSHLGLEMRTSTAFHLIANAECPVLTITS